MKKMKMYFINMACVIFPDITVDIQLEADYTKWDKKFKFFLDDKCMADV